MNRFPNLFLAIKLWLLSNLVLSLGAICYLFFQSNEELWLILPFSIVAAIGSIPVVIILVITIPIIKRSPGEPQDKLYRLWVLLLLIATAYGLGAGFIEFFIMESSEQGTEFMAVWAVCTGCLTVVASVASLLLHQQFRNYFNDNSILISSKNKSNSFMEQQIPEARVVSGKPHSVLLKGIIVGVLILIMMIPSIFIVNLVKERQSRQKEIVGEVSSKWANSQMVSGPFLVMAYEKPMKNEKGQLYQKRSEFIVLPENLDAISYITPEIRPRSIYKVLLYKSDINYNGHFVIRLPKDVNSGMVKWEESKICFTLSDIKGIEQRLLATINRSSIELSPGLPVKSFGQSGLSANADISAAFLNEQLPFSLSIKLKGSEQFHYLPLAGNSNFSIKSKWPDPSFDGNYLPDYRTISDTGFNARWSFNKANLPFGTLITDTDIDLKDLAFGVTMLQPTDQYSKTERSVKYAILFIGLSFAVFFLVELLQKKAIHPVQYVLIGLALCIFYTLLLSISEFLQFDVAYLVAAIATICLITIYAQSHFNSWKPASYFFLTLSCLYGFMFVLIRLEDTALLIGSIGLFIILAIAMFVTRKIKWYGNNEFAAG